MSEIYNRRIDHPSAWTSAAIGGKEGLTHRMGAEHVGALKAAVARTRDRAPWETTAADFSDPALLDLAAAARDEIMNGKGAVILSGLDMGETSLEDYERIYWGIGAHLGRGAVQSYRRDHIGKVQKEKDNPTGRGYLMDVELRFHTDFHEILSLAGFRKSAEGGCSGLASSLAVHNAIQKSRPELLAPLYEGFYHESAGAGQVSQTKVPIFCCVDGKVSCYYHGLFMTKAAKQMGVELPADLVEAMDYFNEQARRPDIAADFMLEAGEMMFWHNFTALHARTAFNDTEEQKRLLLRLWLNVEHGRPMAPEFTERARYMDKLHESGEAAIKYAEFYPAQASQA